MDTPITRPDWLDRTAWPWEVRTLTIPSGRIAYTDTGSGPILLLVHSGTWSFIWRDLITRLAPHFRVITFDPPAMGLSDTGAGAGIAPTADTIDALVTGLDLKDVTLVLHDLGGPAGLDAAARWPERVAGLAAVNCFGWQPSGTGFTTMLRVVGSGAFREFDAATDFLPAISATKYGVGRHFTTTDRKIYRKGFGPRGRRSFHQNMASALDHDYAPVDAGRQALADRPILTVFGEKNDPMGFQPRWKAAGADVEQVVVPGGLHFPMCDDPDLVAESITDWHARKAPRSSQL
jgi:pimeloyl-ACP methyl ester carboxylesterase